MGVVTPETGAIDNYLWVGAQNGIAEAIEIVRDVQKAINIDYDFDIFQNKYRPSIEEIEDKAFVNILIDSVVSGSYDSNFSKTHTVTYNVDCYVRGKNEDHGASTLVPADEVAVQRMHYLCAMVEYALTSLVNFDFGIDSGKIAPGKISLQFDPVDNASESATPYAPSRFQFVCDFPYEPQDLEDLPDLKIAFLNFGTWASQYDY